MAQILVTTDFSDAAHNACCYAVDMATDLGASLLILHVTHYPVVYPEIPVALNLEDVFSAAERQMQELKDELENRSQNRIIIETEIRTGDFYNELEGRCLSFQPYLVIMGSQGKTALEHLLFGSNTAYAMRKLRWPLLTVSAAARYTKIKKIGLSTDFEKIMDTVPANKIKDFIKDFKAELHILYSKDDRTFNPSVVFGSGLSHELFWGIKPEFHFTDQEDIYEGIMNLAANCKIDMLILLPRTHSIIDRLLNRSQSKKFIMYSQIPILILHKYSE